MNSDARYSGADAAAGAGIRVDDGVAELRTQTSLLSEESKAHSIASHGLGIVAGAQPEKSTSIAGCGGDCACAPLPSNGEESPKQIIDAAAEETGPKELGGPVTAGVDKLCDLSCSVLQKFMSWTARKRTENLYIADGDIETPDETPNEPPVSDWKPVRSGEKGDECADALTRDSQLTSECKFLKNSTIDARSVGEISEITRERPRGFLPSTRLGRKPLKTHEEEEPGTPGTDIATIGKFSTICFFVSTSITKILSHAFFIEIARPRKRQRELARERQANKAEQMQEFRPVLCCRHIARWYGRSPGLGPRRRE